MRAFIEVGPQQVLTGLNRQILAGRQVACLPTDHPQRTSSEIFLRVRAQIECWGLAASDAGRQGASSKRSEVAASEAGGVPHFDATQRGRTRRPARGEPMPALPSAIDRFDATEKRRQRLRSAAKSRGDALVLPQARAEPAKKPADDALAQFLLDFVTDQTGYPAEFIDLDWDLESDLGLDSIKRAQLFGELSELFAIDTAFVADRSVARSLSEFRTLRQLLGLLTGGEGSPAGLVESHTPAPGPPAREPIQEPLSAQSRSARVSDPAETADRRSPSRLLDGSFAANTAPGAEPAAHTPAIVSELEAHLIDLVVEQTGYPPELVDLDADLESDLGLDSIKLAQIIGEIRERFAFSVEGVDRAFLGKVRTLRQVLEIVRGSQASSPPTPKLAIPR